MGGAVSVPPDSAGAAPAGPAPTAVQLAAADPARSAWVGANAGSGKTRVLTNRVARLLLAGSAPGRILCLTYTRAAAAEMQSRLFGQLGAWAMLGDDALAATLVALSGGTAAVDAAALARARRLFATALETPGGLRIQTIHAFCEHLLRRFPLEADAPPGFAVAEERQAAMLAEDVRRAMAESAAAGRDDAFDRLARRLSDGAVEGLGRQIARLAPAIAAPADVADRLAAHYGAAAADGAEAAVAAGVSALDWAAVAALAP
ncbi:MAG: UvrD-helicase domain-containing protein, partial [Pseudomonadota bacterium]